MVTRLGFGSALLGGLFAPMDDESAAAVLAAVWDSGSRYIFYELVVGTWGATPAGE